MNDTTVKAMEMESSQQELHRLIRWIKDNPKDWNIICEGEIYSQNIAHITNLIERLYREKLYTVIFFVIYKNQASPEMERANAITISECFLDVPAEVLMERFRRNIGYEAGKVNPKEQPEEK